MAAMTLKSQHSPRRRNSTPSHLRLLADPTTKQIIRLQLHELRRRPSARALKPLVCFLVSWILVTTSQRFPRGTYRAFRRQHPGPLWKIIWFPGAAARRFGAVTLSTSVIFVLCMSLDILSPRLTRSGSDKQELRLGALLLPPGQEDTLSDDDGWETPDATRFPEPPPSDFGEIPLPRVETYTFEASPGFHGGNSEESASHMEEILEQIERERERIEPPAPPSPTSKLKPDNLPTPRQAPRVASNSVPKRPSDPKDTPLTETAIMRRGMRAPSQSAFLRFPLDRVQISSGYGMRKHPILRTSLFHRGIDLRAERGTPVHAAAAGRVIFARRSGGKGNTIAIDHGNGVKTVYAHLQTMLVRIGQSVEAGQLIAKSGATGRVTAPHLHFEVWSNGHHTDPLTALPPSPRSLVYTQGE